MSAERLMLALWGEEAPPTAIKALGAAAWEQGAARGAALSVRQVLDLVQPRATVAAR